jgi:hypothetical protein
MNKRLMAASATLATATALCLTAPALAACDPATQALVYLSSQQKASGSIDDAVGETADFVLGATAAGYDPNTLAASSGKSPFDWFIADVQSGSPKSTTDPNADGKLIQAVVAGRRDPRNFGSVNLLAKLQSFYQPSTGAYASPSNPSDPCAASANAAICQSNAILGLRAANDSGYPVPANAVTFLKSLQATAGPTQGAWGSYSPGDTNATSMALMALTAAGDTASNDAGTYSSAFTFLHSQQDPASGGFPYAAAFGTASDPDSDALVVQGLVAAGQDPSSGSWTNLKGNAPTDILRFQDPGTGGFTFPGNPGPDAFTTSEVPAAIKQAPFPVSPFSYVRGTALPTSCAAAASPSPVSAAGTTTGGGAAANGAAPALPRSGASSADTDRAPLPEGALTGLPVLALGTLLLTRRALSSRRRR